MKNRTGILRQCRSAEKHCKSDEKNHFHNDKCFKNEYCLADPSQGYNKKKAWAYLASYLSGLWTAV